MFKLKQNNSITNFIASKTIYPRARNAEDKLQKDFLQQTTSLQRVELLNDYDSELKFIIDSVKRLRQSKVLSRFSASDFGMFASPKFEMRELNEYTKYFYNQLMSGYEYVSRLLQKYVRIDYPLQRANYLDVIIDTLMNMQVGLREFRIYLSESIENESKDKALEKNIDNRDTKEQRLRDLLGETRDIVSGMDAGLNENKPSSFDDRLIDEMESIVGLMKRDARLFKRNRDRVFDKWEPV